MSSTINQMLNKFVLVVVQINIIRFASSFAERDRTSLVDQFKEKKEKKRKTAENVDFADIFISFVEKEFGTKDKFKLYWLRERIAVSRVYQ